ncbi:hypothetical protein BBP40_000558 [Aspergillus hancockii]|nr:hypothetical protein BBP40_000558 [Aspergillus hancockii]
MDLPYRPSKYALRAPPPIPPRPGRGADSRDVAPPLPPRPHRTADDGPPPLPPRIQQSLHPASQPPQTPRFPSPPPPYQLETPIGHSSAPEPPYQPPRTWNPVQYPYPAEETHSRPAVAQPEITTPVSYPASPPSQHQTASIENNRSMYSRLPENDSGTYQAPSSNTSCPSISPAHEGIPSYDPAMLGNTSEPAGVSYEPRLQSPYARNTEPSQPDPSHHTSLIQNESVPPSPPRYDSQIQRQYNQPDALIPLPLFSPGGRAQPKRSSSIQRHLDEFSSTPASPTQLNSYSYPGRNDQRPPSAAVEPLSTQYDPPATSTLKQCPWTNYSFTRAGLWYILAEVPEFRICTYCYEKHIRDSQFDTNFQPWVSPAGTTIHCLFSSPRIENHLWPQVLQTGDLQPLQQFFQRRTAVANCSGTKGVPASEKTKWYSPKDKSDLPDFAACEACYEDILLASAFPDKFQETPERQPHGELWLCDVSFPFIKRQTTHTQDWQIFVTRTAHHMKLPDCKKNDKVMAGYTQKWYQFRDPTLGIAVCERCYLDFVALTDFEHHLQPLQRPHSPQQCILGFWTARVVWDEALRRKDFSLWRRTIMEFSQTAPCDSAPQYGARMYQLTHGGDNFDVCQSCYVGFLKPCGLDRYFKHVQHPSTLQSACNLNPANARFASYAPKLDEALITGNFTIFSDFAARLCDLPACPRIELVACRKWYGVDGCRICLSCYEEVIRGTVLAPELGSDPVEIPGEQHCDLYSPRMRRKWAEACETGDLASFMAFASYRRAIYDQTVPEMRNIVAMARFNQGMQQMYNVSSSFYNNMDGMTASVHDPRISYGAAGLTQRFDTPWGVEGAQLGQKAQSYIQGMSGDMGRVAQLQAMWDAVE